MGYADAIAVTGSSAYVTGTSLGDSTSRLYTLDVSSPASPWLLGNCDLATLCPDVTLGEDSIAFVTGYLGLLAIDVGNLQNPEEIGQYQTPGFVYGVDVSENFAYLAFYDAGFKILNVSEPANPIEVGESSTPGRVFGIIVREDYAFVADGDSGLQIYSIAEKTDPVAVGYCLFPGVAQSVALQGDFAYLAAGVPGGLRIINVSDPYFPQEAGSFVPPSWPPWDAYDVAVSGNYAYLADGESGLRVIDVSDPANPFQVAIVGQGGWYNSVAVSGNYAYVLSYSTYLQIYQISNPASPVLVGSTADCGGCEIKVVGEHAFIAASSAGLKVLNIADPASPYLVGSYNTKGLAYGVAVSGNNTYLADGYNFGVYDCSQALPVAPIENPETPKTFALQQNYPNPFNPVTAISYQLPVATQVNLAVYDINGRLVSTLVEGWRRAGEHTVIFDGSHLVSGIYLYKLTAGQYQVIGKMALIK
jgi:hypothetical protein